jgi:hypothetical protein
MFPEFGDGPDPVGLVNSHDPSMALGESDDVPLLFFLCERPTVVKHVPKHPAGGFGFQPFGDK